ncbi:MAG: hypothetical protein HYU76_11600 [Betaproteobacteria bacterium]|nr:hypothetical protein [Betaproteobacteria bacterium]
MAGCVAGALLAVAGASTAATTAFPDIPTPYLASTAVAVDEMLRLAGVGPGDVVVDLGSGERRVMIEGVVRSGAGRAAAVNAWRATRVALEKS